MNFFWGRGETEPLGGETHPTGLYADKPLDRVASHLPSPVLLYNVEYRRCPPLLTSHPLYCALMKNNVLLEHKVLAKVLSSKKFGYMVYCICLDLEI